MCIGKDLMESNATLVKCTGQTVMDGISNNAETNFQLIKPKLSRKITSSVKLNLNKYWTKFGEIMTSPTKRTSSSKPIARSPRLIKNLFPQDDNTKPLITSNIQNSLQAIDELKKQRFELLQDDGCEVEDNLANEIREICRNRKE